jgi:hypothetical protein
VAESFEQNNEFSQVIYKVGNFLTTLTTVIYR